MKLVFHRSFLFLLLLCGLMGGSLYSLLTVYGTATWLGALSFCLPFLLVNTSFLLLHECFHALMGRGLGFHPEAIILTGRGGECHFPEEEWEARPKATLLVLLAGPVGEFSTAQLLLLLLFLTHHLALLPLTAGACFATLNSFYNLLPLHPGSDGWSACRTVVALLHQRGRRPPAPAPTSS